MMSFIYETSFVLDMVQGGLMYQQYHNYIIGMFLILMVPILEKKFFPQFARN